MPANEIDQQLVRQWMAARQTPEAIEAELTRMGYDSGMIGEYLLQFRKLGTAKRQMNGFLALGLGAFLGFVSCVLTLVNPVPSLYEVILYGLTSVAILIIFVGLYLVFED